MTPETYSVIRTLGNVVGKFKVPGFAEVLLALNLNHYNRSKHQ